MEKVSAYAPGRVEWLGNHTDYNEGYVLSAALEIGTSVDGKKRSDGKVVLHSVRFGEDHQFDLKDLKPLPEKHWSNYVRGVVAEIVKKHQIAGFEATISGKVPIGAGLASSASLTVSSALFSSKLHNFALDKHDLALIAQAAEHNYVGVKCGLLDQITSIFSEEGKATFIDFRSLEAKNIPVPEGVDLVIVNSGVKHALVAGEYNERRQSCESAAKALGKKSLREVNSQDLESGRTKLTEVEFRRAKHVVGENERVLSAIKALESDDIVTVGKLMKQSHQSSKDNFENSSPELDYLVDIASSLKGCYGARLSGGGFGGATINLLASQHTADFGREIIARYNQKFGFDPDVFVTKPGAGAN